jgi:hypothetical protein
VKNWILKETDADIVLMARTLKIDESLCHILANRGVRSKNNAIKFLNPLLEYLRSIEGMSGVWMPQKSLEKL